MSADPDLTRHALASFAFLIERDERLSPADLAERIAHHYDVRLPQTAAAIETIRALPADLVLVGRRTGAYQGRRHTGNVATIDLEATDAE